MKLKAFQIWINRHTCEIYESRMCQGGFIMYTPLSGGMFIDQNFIDNQECAWVYIGELN